MRNSFWIKERHNPQFDKPYYVLCGQLSFTKARRMEHGTLYGYNQMLEYKTQEEYEAAAKQFRDQGFEVH